MKEAWFHNFSDLLDHFGAATPESLNHHVYKETNCGASVSIRLKNKKWLHNGDDWGRLSMDKVVAFRFHSIVEGSDAEVSTSEFQFPVKVKEVMDEIQGMEDEAEELWHDANDDELTRLLGHADHNIELAYYGKKSNPESVTIECTGCGMILLHLRLNENGHIEVGAIDEER